MKKRARKIKTIWIEKVREKDSKDVSRERMKWKRKNVMEKNKS